MRVNRRATIYIVKREQKAFTKNPQCCIWPVGWKLFFGGGVGDRKTGGIKRDIFFLICEYQLFILIRRRMIYLFSSTVERGCVTINMSARFI